jgi:hypothetical protein
MSIWGTPQSTEDAPESLRQFRGYLGARRADQNSSPPLPEGA